ncbi:RsbT co-antagonist protein RsbRB [Priestia megaterium]|nr:RsbT co-antagonist protein RsbRB [Priestia megaterium]
MLDISITETVIVFEQVKDEIIKKAQQEVLKLSVPVVRIQDKTAVLPLIGSIDSERAEYILENVILKILEMKVEYLIVDFSGILNIDTIAERYLFDIYSMLRLQGIEVMMTGIRPELAQTVVRNDFDFSSIPLTCGRVLDILLTFAVTSLLLLPGPQRRFPSKSLFELGQHVNL